MENEELEPCWGGDIDCDHLGDALITMGEALKGDGLGLQGVEYNEKMAHEEFATHELTIRYVNGGDTILGNPIEYLHDVHGEE